MNACKINIQLFGERCPPFYGESVEFYEKEKAKALKKIAKQEEIIAVCDEEIAKLNAKNN